MTEVIGMNLLLPSIGTSAQDWARIINDNFAIIDYHNHTLNYGLKIDSSNLANGVLNANGFSIFHVESIAFTLTDDISPPNLSLAVDENGDLIYKNNEFIIHITQGAGLNNTILPQGFTVIGSPAVAIFDAVVTGIRFESSTGADTSTLISDTINASQFNLNGTLTLTDFPTNQGLYTSNAPNQFLKAAFPGPSLTFLPASWTAFDAASIYKLSENNIFYYDAKPVVHPTNNYDLSYFYGAKNWISSPDIQKHAKIGTRYYMRTVSFVITGFKVDETFVLDNNLHDSNLVSFIPKIETTSTSSLDGNGFLTSIPMPIFQIHFTNNSLSVYVNLDFSSYSGLFSSLTISFKIIYIDNNYKVIN